MRTKDGKVTAYKSTQKTGKGYYGNYDRHTGNLYQYNHKDSSGGHTYVTSPLDAKVIMARIMTKKLLGDVRK